MAFDAHKNFAYSTVVTPPSPATSGTSIVVGNAALFPAAPFNVTIWPAYPELPTSTSAEIARCTAISGNTLTITRAQEGSSARTILAGDQIAATITVKTLTDLEQFFSGSYSQALDIGWLHISKESLTNRAALTGGGDGLVSFPAGLIAAELHVNSGGLYLGGVSTGVPLYMTAPINAQGFGEIAGTVTLSGGTATVTTDYILANTLVFLTPQSASANRGHLEITARTPAVPGFSSGTFTITSSNASDNRSVAWFLVEP
jgi:hypothetical protein